MNSVSILLIIVSFLLGVSTYISTSSFIASGVVLALSLAYFMLYLYPRAKKHFLSSKKFHSCYTFINSFVVSLSIKGSLIGAFDSVKLSMDEEYLSLIDGLNTLKEEEKLDYLKSYFPFDIYSLFVSIIDIFQTQGGNILSLSHYLINELRRSEDYLIKCESIGKRRIIDFSLLWLFSLIILIVLRFALSQFYNYISGLLFYKLAVVGLMILILISIHLLTLRYMSVSIRSSNNV